jgi:ATP-binding cassette, subfamily B (MDR/TAP), member 1
MRLLMRFHERTKKAYESSANFACEATGSIRTVASLTREADVMEIYTRSLDAPSHAAFRMAVFSNIWFGLAETIMFLTMALAFWYGSTLVRTGQYSLTQMFTVFIAMIFGSQSAGQVNLLCTSLIIVLLIHTRYHKSQNLNAEFIDSV